MKRYLLFLFSGDDPFDSVGWRSFHGSFDTPEEAQTYFSEYTDDDCDYYGHIVDMQRDEKEAVILVSDGCGDWQDANGTA
jgi:hypothetical protein